MMRHCVLNRLFHCYYYYSTTTIERNTVVGTFSDGDISLSQLTVTVIEREREREGGGGGEIGLERATTEAVRLGFGRVGGGEAGMGKAGSGARRGGQHKGATVNRLRSSLVVSLYTGRSYFGRWGQ